MSAGPRAGKGPKVLRTFACLAGTLDGRIAETKHPDKRFGSQADLHHLLHTRLQADAVLVGGETFRQYPHFRRGNPQHAPLQCILTRTGNLPPESPLFQSMQANPAWRVVIFSPLDALPTLKKQYPETVQWVQLPEHSHPARFICDYLQQKGIQALCIEGGGMLVNHFLQARLLQEFFLTLCPLFLSGDGVPLLVSGEGFGIEDAPRTVVRSSHWIEQELYLHLEITYPTDPLSVE